MKKEEREELEAIINDKLERLRSGAARNHLLKYPTWTKEGKAKNEEEILVLTEPIEKSFPFIKSLLGRLKTKIGSVGDQNKWSAVYILLGKVFSNLQTIVILLKKGRNLEMMDISRSAQESMDLIFLFLESEDDTLLQKWFRGEIIKNEKARELFDRIINKGRKEISSEPNDLPVYAVKRHMYNLFSQYTHSGYGAILDSIDFFNEDLDFDRLAGFHWSRRNFHVVKNVILTLVIQFKGIFLKLQDKEGFQEADKCLKSLNFIEATEDEIQIAVEKYKDH